MAAFVWGPWARRIVVYLGCCFLFPAIAAPASSADGPSQAQRQFTVGVPKSFPPYYQLDEDGNPSGFAVDAMNEVAKRAGFKVTYRVAENGAANFKAIRAGDIDIIPSLGINDYRKQYVAFTQPVDTFRILLFVRNDTQDITGIDDMVGRPVAVVVDNVGYRFLKKKRPDIQIKVFPKFSDALFALLSAKVDAFAYPEPVTWKLAREIGVSDQIKVAAKPLFETKRAMAVHKDRVELLAVLDQAVRDFVASPEYQDIYVAWFGKPDPFWTVAQVSWTLGGILAVSLAAIFGWHYRSVISLNRALRDSEELFRALFENLPLSIHIKDRQGRYLLANKAHMARTGKSLDEIKGKTAFDFFPQDVASAFTALDSEVFDSGQAITRETDLPTSFDGLRQILVTKFPILSPGGVPEAIGVINVDVTEQKQAEAKLKASQNRLAEILDIAPDAVITVGADMRIQLFNQGAERIFGYDAEKVIGQPLEILMPERFRKDHQKHIKGFDNSGDTYRLMDQRQEIIGLRKDGTEFPASASVSKLDIGGERIFTVMLQDITERKKAQDTLMAAMNEAQTASRAKSEFLAAMSHDFRTPLNAILGFADILSHQYFGPIDDKYREYADDIQASGQHLLTLVNDILDLSTIEAGKQSLVKEKLSTMEIITECERIVEEKARSHGIDLVTEVPEDLPPLYADRRASKQILLNLLSNAIKFTPQGGRITVSATASKKNTTLKIADTGKGIPPEKLPGLTDPFIRADTDPYLAEKGWGLGLSITKSLVELHDGTLDIKSKVGKGTTVTVTFPAKAA